jgi:SAM-dependent methyltransferase
VDTSLIAPDIAEEQRVWKSDETLAFYRQRRRSPTELYRSERFFLPDILRQVRSVIDIGCAAGGFLGIMRSFNPSLRYVGMDITPDLIEIARREYPDGEFYIGDGIHFPFPPGSFDLAHSSGVLHLNSRYRDILQAMWQQTGRYLLCDLRLTPGPAFTGTMSEPTLPYHVLNIDATLNFLKTLNPAPGLIRAKGYSHPAAPAARLPQQDIIMACFLLEKRAEPRPIMEIDFNAA